MKKTIIVKQINVQTGEIAEVEETTEVNEEDVAKQFIQVRIHRATQYLASTAWYVERLNDPSSGKAIPSEVLTKRAEARELINTLEAELKEGEVTQ